MRVRTLINLVLALEMALAVVSLGICAGFVTDSPWVARLDTSVKEWRVRDPQRELERISEAYAADKDVLGSIADLTGLLATLEHVQKTDAAQSTRRAAYAGIVSLCREVQAFDAALAWAGEWVAFDPLDVQARAERAALLMLDPASRAEALAEFDSLAQRFPESMAVADARAGALGQLGQLGDAFAVLAPFVPTDGERADWWVPRIGDTFPHPLETRFLHENQFVAVTFYWVLDRRGWTLTVMPGVPYDSIRLQLPPSDPMDIAILDGADAGSVLALGLEERGPLAWRKPPTRAGALIIEGASRQLLLDVRFAPPATLLTLVSPQVTPVLAQQLGNDRHLLDLLDAARGRYAQDR